MCGQAQVREDPEDHRRRFDGSDDPERAATLRAVFEVDTEHALEQARPTHASWHTVRVFDRGLAGIAWWTRHDRGTQPGIGCQCPVKADQLQAWSRHQRDQALQEFQRRHLDVRRAVAPGDFSIAA